MKITAVYLFNRYADERGLVSIVDILENGWTEKQAENEGLIIKEKFKYDYIVTSAKKHEIKGKRK